MKHIPIKNLKFLHRLDHFAQSLYRYPHTWVGLPKPDLKFSTLRTYQNDDDFVGYPKEHNYRDYSGLNRERLAREDGASFNDMKTHFIRAFRAGIEGAESPEWYYDTLTVMAPDKGFTGWHNNKNKPHISLRFIHNAGRGYSVAVRNKRVTKVPDQWGVRRGTGNWTCVRNDFDGETWFADKNQGSKPRFVVDIAIPRHLGSKADAVESFITNFV
tara:strand:+ start:270 stop:914 length:645 start_codon:yes stop_codon:yes gene_type:complete